MALITESGISLRGKSHVLNEEVLILSNFN